LTREEFIENSADAPGLAKSLESLQNLWAIARTKWFLWQSISILKYSYKGFSISAQMGFFKR